MASNPQLLWDYSPAFGRMRWLQVRITSGVDGQGRECYPVKRHSNAAFSCDADSCRIDTLRLQRNEDASLSSITSPACGSGVSGCWG